MKRLVFLFIAATAVGPQPALAQFSPSEEPPFDPATAMLFGTNRCFSAAVEFQMSGGVFDNGTLTVPGNATFDSGKSRLELNLNEMVDSGLPPKKGEQTNSVNENCIFIIRPDLRVNYTIYPGLNCYAATATSNSSSNSSTNEAKLTLSEIGKETVDGHACVKNHAVVIDKAGTIYKFTVWNASDIRNFPIKIATTGAGTFIFRNISFGKPAVGAFEAPSSYTKYNDLQKMDRDEVGPRMLWVGIHRKPAY